MNKIIRTALFGPEIESRDAEPEIEERSFVTDLGVAFAAYLDSAGSSVTPDYAIPAAYRGVQILCDTVASLPLNAVRESSGEIISKRPQLLAQPEVGETYHDSMAKIIASLIFDGNAYLLPMTRTSAGEVTSIAVPNPSEVQVEWDKRQYGRVYSWRDRDVAAGKEIFHISLNKYPGALKGVGPFTANRVAMFGAKAEQNMARRLFEDDATPSTLIKVPQPLTQDEATLIQERWEAAHKNRKKPAVLSGGIDVVPLSFSPLDAQFLESRKFSVADIARMLGLPAFYLNADMGGLTYSTTESLSRLFLTTTLNPTYLERIEQAFSLLLPLGQKAKFDTSELLRADQSTRYSNYNAALSGGWLTTDEVRAEEGLKPLPQEEPEPVAQPEPVVIEESSSSSE